MDQPKNHDHAKAVLSTLAVSEEEMKVRREIEREIERDLEEEIKGGIFRQGLRLLTLYRHRKQSEHASRNSPEKKKKEILEVNISIRMEGGTKIEIKESPEINRPRTSRSDAGARTPAVDFGGKRVDWVKSLRSSSSPAVVRSKTPAPGSDQCRCRRPK